MKIEPNTSPNNWVVGVGFEMPKSFEHGFKFDEEWSSFSGFFERQIQRVTEGAQRDELNPSGIPVI